MNILLDTHTLIWLFDEPEKLSEKAAAVIKDKNNTHIISIASLWEAAIKTNLNKLELKLPFAQWENEISLYNFIILDIKFQHLSYYTSLPLLHKDPFDRVLVAQVVTEELIIAAKDEKITQYNVQTIW